MQAAPAATVPSGTQASVPMMVGIVCTRTHVHFSPVAQFWLPGGATGSQISDTGASTVEASTPPIVPSVVRASIGWMTSSPEPPPPQAARNPASTAAKASVFIR
jgi:hypothetical protein